MGGTAGQGPEDTESRRTRVREYSRAARQRLATDPAKAEAVREADRARAAKRRERLRVGKAALPEEARARPPRAHELTGETWLQRKVRLTRERRHMLREQQPDLYWARMRAQYRHSHKDADPEGHARRMETQRLRRGTASQWTKNQPSGSVLATAAPSYWRDLLAEISRLVPRWDDRDEVIAEAALLSIEGFTIPEAVAQAKRAVARSAAPYRQMRQIEDCHWL